jgi:predicted NBD/HSP70 family sugar kinase
MVPEQSDRTGGEVSSVTAGRVLCYDIGGTYLRGAVHDEAGRRVMGPWVRPTPNYLTHPNANPAVLLSEVVRECGELGNQLLQGSAPSSVVVGYPGPVDETGSALRSPTILGPERDGPFDVGAAFRAIWPKATVCVVNDLACAGLFFVEQGYNDFCVITVGSGIGNKVFINGEPILGPRGRGGEIGHLAACSANNLPFGFPWTEVGEVSSGRGTAALALAWAEARPTDFEDSRITMEDLGLPTDQVTESLARCFREGDEMAHSIVAAAAQPLAFAIAAIHQAIGTESFLIIGGFAKALGERYRTLLASLVAEMAWNLGQDWNSMIRLGDVHNEEGVSGAAHYAMKRLSEQHRRQAEQGYGCTW